MSRMTPELGDAPRIGAGSGPRGLSETAATGAVVQEYADLMCGRDRGHEWASVHRCAVAFDAGPLGVRRHR
ncbi:hypothetical protein [Rhodococcus jostii]|uniref:hypothetical protein n=1 Tax=Rhodococcus jostii TaxID=132919 RepID=UPI003653EE90